MVISNKHIEVIICQMICWGLITDGGGTPLIVEEKVDKHRFKEINEQTLTEAVLEGRVDYAYGFKGKAISESPDHHGHRHGPLRNLEIEPPGANSRTVRTSITNTPARRGMSKNSRG
ncbi:hypothetical protein GETHOR_25710 [Geothrix oryzae]|uniref:Uncharacterized protein n=1 Tax=Geothrix oryzae TaxID=2927975 RepID=A0ABN6V2Z6_9BACT|nr:hypothetical protein GETHOR_25710 [Geothrix oryzae]